MILVFNFAGYRMVITCMERGNDAVLEKKLDQRIYNEDELLTIKTKLNLPYYTSSPEFQRTYGSVNINGVVYEYVKKRVYNDTLELVCLPNTAKTALQEAKNELAKSAIDGQASAPVKKAPSTVKLSLPDFCQSLPTFEATAFTVATTFGHRYMAYPLSGFSTQQERPPQAISSLS